MLRYTLSTLLFVLGMQLCQGQADVHVSQFFELAITRNPALTGVFADDYKASCFYRSQWASVSNPYTTYLFSAETKLPISSNSDDFVSFGLLAYQDKAGFAGQQITSIYPAISYNKLLNADYNTYLSFGLAGAYSQYSFDQGKVTFNNQYDNGIINPVLPSLENISSNEARFGNLAAGINLNTSNNHENTVVYCFGVSGYNLINKPYFYFRQSNASINLRVNINAGVAIKINEDSKIQFHTNYAQQGKFNEIMAGFLYTWNPVNRIDNVDFALSLGAIYRYNDAIAPVIKYKYHKAAISASYDINISSFQPATNLKGGLELSLSLIGEYNQRKQNGRTTICPRF